MKKQTKGRNMTWQFTSLLILDMVNKTTCKHNIRSSSNTVNLQIHDTMNLINFLYGIILWSFIGTAEGSKKHFFVICHDFIVSFTFGVVLSVTQGSRIQQHILPQCQVANKLSTKTQCLPNFFCPWFWNPAWIKDEVKLSSMV